MARPLAGRKELDELTTNVRKAAALKAALELDVFSRIAEENFSLPAFCRVTATLTPSDDSDISSRKRATESCATT